MKTDSLFYTLFQTLPGTFFEIIGQDPDTAEGYRFSSVEIKEPTFRMDGVFAPVEDDPEKPIYFAEVQFQLDKQFYWRFFAEVFLYLEQEKPDHDWRAVVLFASRTLNPEVPRAFRALIEPHLVVGYLDESGKAGNSTPGMGIVQVIVSPDSEAREKARWLSEELHKEPGSAGKNQEVIKLLEAAVIYKFPGMTTKELEAMFQLEDLKQTRVYQEAWQDGERIGEKRGEKKGEKKGKKIGEKTGKLATVPLLLQLGGKPAQIAGALGLELDEVNRVAAHLPDSPDAD